jgi:hypothetical protein
MLIMMSSLHSYKTGCETVLDQYFTHVTIIRLNPLKGQERSPRMLSLSRRVKVEAPPLLS